MSFGTILLMPMAAKINGKRYPARLSALTGGHMGTYLGLFNGTICVPQIVAASLGGIVLKIFTSPVVSLRK